MEKRTVDTILASMGLKFEDIFEPDLKKQYENYKLLCYLLGDKPLPEPEARKQASMVGRVVRR